MALNLLLFLSGCFLLESSKHYDPVFDRENGYVSACHRYGGPGDQNLRCDSSPNQIVFNSDQQCQQKQNLIVFDIDLTILESARGFHDAIPLKYRQNGTHCFSHEDIGLDMMFIQSPCPYSVVFRHRFLDVLEYIHTNLFSADLVLYTRARWEYALEIAVGITRYYNLKYNNDSDHTGSFVNLSIFIRSITNGPCTEDVFKMVVSSTTQQTAKTLSTLSHKLNLSQYEHIIILDDDAENCWCKYRMIRLRLLHRVNVMLIEVPMLFIWRDIHREFSLARRVSTQPRLVATQFYCMVSKYQVKDELFAYFHDFLELLYVNASVSNDNLFKYASLIRDESGFNHMTRILWKWTKTK